MKVFQTTPRILMGAGSFNAIAGEARLLGASRAIVFAGPNIVKAGYAADLEGSLGAAGMKVEVFSEIEPDPSDATAVKAGRAVREAGADLVIGIGGGSNMDIAKVASVLATNDLSLEEMYGPDLVPRPGIDKILVPTTAGTGSEVTPVTVVSDGKGGTKKVVASPYILPRVAVLDPVLTLSLPPAPTAYSGMDALVHAIEAFTSLNATAFTDLFAERAMRLISSHIRNAHLDGRDLDARAAMLEGSMIAGMAFGNAGVTATHAFSYPIGARYHIPHGMANSIMLPSVMEYNLEASPARFAEVGRHIGVEVDGLEDREAALAMVDALRTLIADLELPTDLSGFGARAADVGDMSADVVANERIMANNPRPLTQADAEAIFRSVL